ncbi:uncharacterized protein LOC144120365 [Amblyomma americanum]
MDLMKLLRTDLVSLCKELGVEVEEKMKKSNICTLLLESAEEETVSNTWELIKVERKKKENEQKQIEEQRLAAEQEERELRRLQLAHEQKKLEYERSRGTTLERASQAESFHMDRLMQPYKIGEDLGYYLVNFERTCEKRGYAKETWPQRLLMVLPCEAATIVARLNAKDADDYEKVKASLLRKYRLSAEEFRQRFRRASKKSSESCAEFAFSLKANLTEWLKGAEAYDTKDKVVECVGLEQFYNSIPEAVKLWVQDRENVSTVEKAAELADEYATRRKLSPESSESEKKAFGLRKRFIPKNRSQFRNRETVEGTKQAPKKTEDRAKQAEAQKALTKEFEARKPFRCFNCQETGHIAARCKTTRLAFSYVNDSDENLELLRPYIHELQVNGKSCRVLRDSGATMDIVHPSYVKEEDFTGEVAWIRQVLENQSVCLPMARMVISGPFGELVTEAAISSAVSLQCPYLFSNKSNQLLCDRGQKLAEGTVKALTRSKSRELASKLRYSQESEATEPAESDYTSPLILVEAPGRDPRPCVDYRKLNTITKDQLYPIPNIEERIETVSAAQYIYTLDLEYDIRVVYRSGRKRSDADALFRSPLPSDTATISSIDSVLSSLHPPNMLVEQRNGWVIVAIDHLTRYAETAALPPATAREVAFFILRQLILRHGAPRDGAYPLQPWVITPIPGHHAHGSPAARFNSAHSALRSVVERTVGVLKSRLRCLQRYRELHYEPEVAAKIVAACAVLHNVCIYVRQPYLDTYDSDDPDGDTDQCEEQEIPALYRIGRSKLEQLLQAFAHRHHR